MKKLILAAALASGLSTAAVAQAPASKEDCLQQSLDLARLAEEKKLGEDKLAKLEESLGKMEGECEGGKYDDAAKTAAAAKAMIEGK